MLKNLRFISLNFVYLVWCFSLNSTVILRRPALIGGEVIIIASAKYVAVLSLGHPEMRLSKADDKLKLKFRLSQSGCCC